ncbi:MAG TPA: oligosaccharide flippase family protein [Steroidobacteraceae bacterium]|jgi:PST family polysaccharide transporter
MSNPGGNVSRSKTANSMVWSLIENGGLALISFVSLIVYLRILSIADFGIFSTALALIELLGVLVTMLFHNALVQRPVATELHFNTAFTATMGLSVLMAFGCWAMATAFAAWIHQPNAARVLAWLSLIFPCSAASATLVARQRREFAFRTLALRSLIGRFIGGGIGIAAAILGAGLWSLVLQQILIAAIGSFVLWIMADRTPRLQFRYSEFKQLFGFGVLSVSGLFLSTSIRRVFTLLATSFLGVEAAGFLNLSFRVVDVFWVIAATAVAQVALPMLAGLQFDSARLKRAYQASTQFSCLAIYPCFVGLACVAPDVIDLLFGHRWQPSSPYVAVLGFLVLLQAPRMAFTPLLTALGKPRDPLVGLVAELVFMLTIVLLSKVPSLPWAIGIWAASEAVLFLVSGWVLRRATGYSVIEQFHGVPKPLFASLLMAAAVIETGMTLPVELGPILRLTVLIPLGMAVFTAAIFLLDRKLVKDFWEFVQAAFERRLKNTEIP